MSERLYPKKIYLHWISWIITHIIQYYGGPTVYGKCKLFSNILIPMLSNPMMNCGTILLNTRKIFFFQIRAWPPGAQVTRLVSPPNRLQNVLDQREGSATSSRMFYVRWWSRLYVLRTAREFWSCCKNGGRGEHLALECHLIHSSIISSMKTKVDINCFFRNPKMSTAQRKNLRVDLFFFFFFLDLIPDLPLLFLSSSPLSLFLSFPL